MTASCFDISVSGQAWEIPDMPSEVQPAYQRLFISAATTDVQETGLLNEIPDMPSEVQPAYQRRADLESLIATTVFISAATTDVQETGLQNYQAIIESLPPIKRVRLWKALSRINGYLLDIELSDDGEIIIETKEDGRDCFYAICTREGDFKGTWISEGIIKKESWSANLPYDFPALSLI